MSDSLFHYPYGKTMFYCSIVKKPMETQMCLELLNHWHIDPNVYCMGNYQ